MSYEVYILQSHKDKGYYVGFTKDINQRFSQHNKGRVRSTKGRTPFSVVYTESFDTLSEARKREKYLKSYKGSREKLAILDKAVKAPSSNG